MMMRASVDTPGAPETLVSVGTVIAKPDPPEATLAVAAADPSANAFALVADAFCPIAMAVVFVALAPEPIAIDAVLGDVTDAN